MKLTVTGYSETPGMFRITSEDGTTLEVDKIMTAYQAAHVIADWINLGETVGESVTASKSGVFAKAGGK